MEKIPKSIIAIRIAYTLLIVSILIGAIVIAYIMKGKLHLFSIGIAEIGLYGAIIFSFLILQQIFSILNNYKWIPSLIKKADKTPKVGLQVVGYREDKKLFKVCLDSIKKQDYPNLNQIIVGIDGNEETDLIMESVFKEVFPFGRILRL
jgi:cellulose synthase/poly-beta-1,6-N-acetylglucosamine synthase-like glycosyltransferase